MDLQSKIRNFLSNVQAPAQNFFQGASQDVGNVANVVGQAVQPAENAVGGFAQNLMKGVQFASQPGNTPMDFFGPPLQAAVAPVTQSIGQLAQTPPLQLAGSALELNPTFLPVTAPLIEHNGNPLINPLLQGLNVPSAFVENTLKQVPGLQTGPGSAVPPIAGLAAGLIAPGGEELKGAELAQDATKGLEDVATQEPQLLKEYTAAQELSEKLGWPLHRLNPASGEFESVDPVTGEFTADHPALSSGPAGDTPPPGGSDLEGLNADSLAPRPTPPPPIGATTSPIEDLIQTHKSAVDTAGVDANQVNLQFRALADKLHLSPTQEWALVNYSQSPTPERLGQLMQAGYDITPDLVQKAEPLLELHREVENARYIRANAAGVATNYLENHIRQSYLEPANQVEQVLSQKGATMVPGFAKQRTIPDYFSVRDELTPRYTTFGQAHAQAEQELGKTLADRELVSGVNARGFVPASQAPLGTKVVTAEYFPRDHGEPYAGPVADVTKLQNYLGAKPEGLASQALDISGRISAGLQHTLLTTPGYAIHGFTIANMIRDVTTGLGDALTGHPIRGGRTALSGIDSALAAFIPGDAGRFEAAHASSIREMAQNGLGYGGKMNYRDLQPNVAKGLSLGSLKSLPGKLQDALVTDPTFHKFMFQRKVNLYENFRDSLVSQGVNRAQAVQTAASQLKAYDGVVNDLTRSPDLKNFLKTFTFAPQYRESIVGSQVNAAKGLFNPTDPKYAMSRRLALGIGATFLAYNALNQKLTGHPMWQNGSGHEFDVAFPEKDASGKATGKVFYVPWMPGTTTVPRAVAGSAIALAQGDTATAAQQASNLMSAPVQALGQTLSGKDYFGRSIIDPTKPALPQQAAYFARQALIPGGVNNLLTAKDQVAQGKTINPVIEAGRVLQLPIKEGTDPNSPNVIAAKAGQAAQATLTDPKDQAAWNLVQKVGTDPESKLVKDALLYKYPDVFSAERDRQIAIAGGDMSKVDPLYTSPAAQDYLHYEQLNNSAAGSADEKAFLKAHPEVTQLIQTRNAYFQANPLPAGVGNQPALQPPVASPYVQTMLTAGMFKDPQVQQYLSDHTAYTNALRQQQGLAPQDQYGNILGTKAAASSGGGYGGGSSYGASATGLRPYQRVGLFGLHANRTGHISNPVRPLKSVKALAAKPTNPLKGLGPSATKGKSLSVSGKQIGLKLKGPVTTPPVIQLGKKKPAGNKLGFKPLGFKPAA